MDSSEEATRKTARLRQIEEIYQGAVVRHKDERADFLQEACGTDTALRWEVESLLACRTHAEEFLESPAMELVAQELARGGRAGAVESVAGWLPTRIGAYRILRLLGEGGMGSVYEAEQEHPRRIVALKVIKPGVGNADTLRRFELESQALGRLQHPGIAQIYEAGAAETGTGRQPFFAMECIRGLSLMAYAEAQRLRTQQRLELMIKICDAVQHAHQRGLIHRDLKPGNILVDEAGQPKILDFGIARVTDCDAQSTLQTSQLLGTLAYMSPEQLLGDPLELDTRSDIYALGVILYELLAGVLPFKLNGGPLEVARIVREENPQPLRSVNREYQGDIETIVSKALEKDKARRYSTAADFGSDMQRYLRNEPIAARPATASYHLSKFARRHWAFVAAVAAVMAVLVGGIVTTSWQAARAERAGQLALQDRDRATTAERSARQERDRAVEAEHRANHERNRAVGAEILAEAQRNATVAAKLRADVAVATTRAVNDFLQNDVLAQAGASKQAGPGINPDRDLKVRTALDRASARLENKFKGEPLVEAAIRQTIGIAYLDLGFYAETQLQLGRAVELRRRALGEEHPDTLNSMSRLASVYADLGKYGLAEPLFTKVLEAQGRVLGGDNADTLDTMNGLAFLFKRQGKHEQAELLYTNVLARQRRLHGEESSESLVSLNFLAVLYEGQGKYAQAEPIAKKVFEAMLRLLGPEHPHTLSIMNTLAAIYESQYKDTLAEPLFVRVLEVERRVLGQEHPDTLIALGNLAQMYLSRRRYGQAEPLLTQALAIKKRVLGAEHPSTLIGMNNLAMLYQQQGKYLEAEPILVQVLEVKRRVLGEENPSTLVGMNNLALMYQNGGKPGFAEPLYAKGLEIQRRVSGEEHPNTLAIMNNLATLYRDQGRFLDSQPLYDMALERGRRVLGPQHSFTLVVMNNIGALQLIQAKYPQAELVLREALSGYQNALPNDWERYHCESMLGMSLAGQSKYAEAEPLAVSGYEGMSQRTAKNPNEGRSKSGQALAGIVQLYKDWGKLEQAAVWEKKFLPGKQTVSVQKP